PLLHERELCAPPLAEMCELAATGALRIVVGGRYPLAEGKRAFEELESRASTGKLVLVP
ncbi:MAG: zinc-binding dehydrogenase, partial [Polyangiaceae bacterium]|nr:zinc-binding dehydrogenase [Polyangiaceae bacterium]